MAFGLALRGHLSNSNLQKMKKAVIKYGLLSGFLLALFMSITIPFMDKTTDSAWAQFIGFAGMIVAFTAIFVAISKYRDQVLNGVVSFGRAFLLGLYIALIASTLYVVTWMLISELFMPDFMDNYIKAAISKINESSLSGTEKMEQINQYEKMAEWYKKPILKFLFTYLEVLPIGILMSLIAAAFLRKNG